MYSVTGFQDLLVRRKQGRKEGKKLMHIFPSYIRLDVTFSLPIDDWNHLIKR